MYPVRSFTLLPLTYPASLLQLIIYTLSFSLLPNSIPSFSLLSLFFFPACKILTPNFCSLSPSVYLKDDSTADHSGGNVLLFIGHPLDFAKLTVQLSMYVGEHRPHRAAGYVDDILTADDQEGQQNQTEEELCHQGPHRRPTLIPSKSPQPNSTTHSLSLQCLLLSHTKFLWAQRKGNSCSPLPLVLSQFGCLSFSSCPFSISWVSRPLPLISISSPFYCQFRSTHSIDTQPWDTSIPTSLPFWPCDLWALNTSSYSSMVLYAVVRAPRKLPPHFLQVLITFTTYPQKAYHKHALQHGSSLSLNATKTKPRLKQS